ncbi:MAG: aminodeoxychorismate/anthranilate synthase component II [candidate division Zixibacteria bacterium]|nr:aminodeoxychorismate/anthranilate synthase component II [candidate division Zixibacteria bacterium]
MLMLIDNYDSFTYNLAQYIGELGYEFQVFRNDEITVKEATALNPSHLVISPGPGRPEKAGISCDLIAHFADSIPILGVCLGHQCIGHVFGASVVNAERLMHGKTSSIYHTGKGSFQGIPSPFKVTRYHSLIVEGDVFPKNISVTAHTSRGEIMGIQVNGRPIEGVQFHPESILTEHGKQYLSNFLGGS